MLNTNRLLSRRYLKSINYARYTIIIDSCRYCCIQSSPLQSERMKPSLLLFLLMHISEHEIRKSEGRGKAHGIWIRKNNGRKLNKAQTMNKDVGVSSQSITDAGDGRTLSSRCEHANVYAYVTETTKVRASVCVSIRSIYNMQVNFKLLSFSNSLSTFLLSVCLYLLLSLFSSLSLSPSHLIIFQLISPI